MLSGSTTTKTRIADGQLSNERSTCMNRNTVSPEKPSSNSTRTSDRASTPFALAQATLSPPAALTAARQRRASASFSIFREPPRRNLPRARGCRHLTVADGSPGCAWQPTRTRVKTSATRLSPLSPWTSRRPACIEVDAVQHHGQLRALQLDAAALLVDEGHLAPAALEALQVPSKDLHRVARLADEDEEVVA
jgi:hypothetical protein